jgi:hypothetical protein
MWRVCTDPFLRIRWGSALGANDECRSARLRFFEPFAMGSDVVEDASA